MNKLFTEFPPISTEEWLETIKKDLKGKDIEKLMRKTIDGLKFMPFYRREYTENLPTTDVQINSFPFLRSAKNNNSWLIRHDFMFNNIKNIEQTLNFAEKYDIDIKGFDFGENFNLSKENAKFITKNAKNIALLAFKNIENAYDDIANSCVKSAFLNFDPITYLAFNGNFYDDKNRIFDNIKRLLNNPLPHIKPLGINILHYANAGATQVMQLAFALAIAEEYINFATDKNISFEKILANMHFNFAVGTEFFIEIAKLRAFRHLFAKFITAYDAKLEDKAKTFVNVTTLRRNKTFYDPYVNMLRTTIEGLAAVVGGADALNIEPFDKIFANPDEFSQHIAINQQHLLKNEAYLDKVIDPAGGSFYVENLTIKLIEEAWKLFLQIQENGGFVKALENNFIHKIINDAATKEQNLVDTGRITLLGTNKYPNQNEKISDKKLSRPTEISDFASSNNFNTLKIKRLAEDFENLRLHIEKNKKSPKVFLFTYGNVAMRRARADFSANFFAAAGFKIIDNIGFNSIEEGIDAAKKSNADIIVLCADDEAYLNLAKNIYNIFKDKIIVIAGNPATRKDIESIGIKHFIHIKSNIYEELKIFSNILN